MVEYHEMIRRLIALEYLMNLGGEVVSRKAQVEARDALENAVKLLSPRVLEYEEATSCPDFGLFYEEKDGDLLLVLNNGGGDEQIFFVDKAGNHIGPNKWEYGKTWRCWTSRPPEDMRNNVSWD